MKMMCSIGRISADNLVFYGAACGINTICFSAVFERIFLGILDDCLIFLAGTDAGVPKLNDNVSK